MNDAEITLIRYRTDRAKEALSAARLMYEKGHYKGGGRPLDYRFAVVFCGEDKHLGKSMGHSSVYKFISSGRKPTGTAIEK